MRLMDWRVVGQLFLKASSLQRKRATLTVAAIAWGTVAIIIKWMVLKHTIGGWWIVGFIVAPLVVFALRGPIWKLVNRREKILREGCGMYAIETVMESFETVSYWC